MVGRGRGGELRVGVQGRTHQDRFSCSLILATQKQPSTLAPHLFVLYPSRTPGALAQGAQDVGKAARTCSEANEVAFLSFDGAREPRQSSLRDPATGGWLLHGLVIVLGHGACCKEIQWEGGS